MIRLLSMPWGVANFPVCLGPRGFLGYKTFSAKTRPVWVKPEQVVTPASLFLRLLDRSHSGEFCFWNTIITTWVSSKWSTSALHEIWSQSWSKSITGERLEMDTWGLFPGHWVRISGGKTQEPERGEHGMMHTGRYFIFICLSPPSHIRQNQISVLQQRYNEQQEESVNANFGQRCLDKGQPASSDTSLINVIWGWVLSVISLRDCRKMF